MGAAEYTLPPMNRRIEVLACSITDTGADAVVNASNDSATLGSGVSRALADECGPELQAEMRAKLEEDLDGVLEEGDCLVTSAGRSTKFRVVLHVPAVDYRGVRARGGSAGVERTVTSLERVEACVEAALFAASELAAREGKPISVAFPLLGAGAGGLSPDAVCRAMITGLREFFSGTPDAAIERVVFAVPERDRFAVCQRFVRDAFG